MVWVGPSLWSRYTHSLLSSLILSFHQAVINPFTPTPSTSLATLPPPPPLTLSNFFISAHLWSNPINPLLVAVWGTGAVGGLEKCLHGSLREAESAHSLRWQHRLRRSHSILYWGSFLQHRLRNYISRRREAPMGCPHWWCVCALIFFFIPGWRKVKVEMSDLFHLRNWLWGSVYLSAVGPF